MYELTERTKRKMSEYQKNRLKQPNTKLNQDDIREIKKLLEEHELRQYEIAEIFGVKQPIISLIKNNKVWTNISIEGK